MDATPNRLTITRPDDWHVHLRDGAMLADAVAATAAQFGRAMVMPNLAPPVVDVARARWYWEAIIDALSAGRTTTSAAARDAFTPLLSLYLTDATRPDEVAAAAREAFIVGYKLYPARATTNAQHGVADIDKKIDVFEAMAAHDLVLQVHGEVTDPQVDVFDREAAFIDSVLAPLHRRLPALKIVFEHVTTEQGVQFVRDAGDAVAATITAHHLMFNRNEMFRGGLRPHAYCLPPLKREHHRQALLAAATGGERGFFLGTDSAPHPRADKESACGCAGIYSAHAAMELYAGVFEQCGALDKLEAFAAHHGADFYGVARNRGTLTLIKQPQSIAQCHSLGGQPVVALCAGETLAWSVQCGGE